MTRKSCGTHWVEVGFELGSVWFRGSRRRFVAVRPDGSVAGVNFRSRDAAILALAKDLRRREKCGEVLQLGDRRERRGFGQGLAALLSLVSN